MRLPDAGRYLGSLLPSRQVTRPVRTLLGVASGLPALAALALPHVADAVRQSGEGVVWAALGLSALGLCAVVAFVWVASGAHKPLAWRLGWVLALTLFGALAAPAFWWIHVRQPDRALAELRP